MDSETAFSTAAERILSDPIQQAPTLPRGQDHSDLNPERAHVRPIGTVDGKISVSSPICLNLPGGSSISNCYGAEYAISASVSADKVREYNNDAIDITFEDYIIKDHLNYPSWDKDAAGTAEDNFADVDFADDMLNGCSITKIPLNQSESKSQSDPLI